MSIAGQEAHGPIMCADCDKLRLKIAQAKRAVSHTNDTLTHERLRPYIVQLESEIVALEAVPGHKN